MQSKGASDVRITRAVEVALARRPDRRLVAKHGNAVCRGVVCLPRVAIVGGRRGWVGGEGEPESY